MERWKITADGDIPYCYMLFIYRRWLNKYLHMIGIVEGPLPIALRSKVVKIPRGSVTGTENGEKIQTVY